MRGNEVFLIAQQSEGAAWGGLADGDRPPELEVRHRSPRILPGAWWGLCKAHSHIMRFWDFLRSATEICYSAALRASMDRWSEALGHLYPVGGAWLYGVSCRFHQQGVEAFYGAVIWQLLRRCQSASAKQFSSSLWCCSAILRLCCACCTNSPQYLSVPPPWRANRAVRTRTAASARFSSFKSHS